MGKKLKLIEPVLKARVWGSRDLRAWYPEAATADKPIGEAWLSPEDCPVLVKLLFPQERLSVQVHPDDVYAAAHGLGRGKSEAWYVVSAEAGAQVGVGLRAGVSLAELESACRAGKGAEMLHWFEVHPGEVVNVPAGTVHAIGGGSVLLEVQQPSDTTYRLDDYGRGRELHLGPGMEVARAAGQPVSLAASQLVSSSAFQLGAQEQKRMLATPHFQLWRWEGAGIHIPAVDEIRWLVCLTAGGPIPKGWLAELAGGERFEQATAGTIMEIRMGTA